MKNAKEVNLQKLRPNLANPQCKAELQALEQKEEERYKLFVNQIKDFKTKILDNQFDIGNLFLKSLLQNFEFLLIYFDSLFLFEDFNKVPGDEEIQKKHLNLKQLMRMKQKGLIIDTSSERSLTKEWEGLLIETFNIDDRKSKYIYQINGAQQQEVKDPKKKETKNQKGQPQDALPAEATTGQTRNIKSFKTFRQKFAFQLRNISFEEFKKFFNEKVAMIKQEMDTSVESELKFRFKWEQMVEELYKQMNKQ